MSVENELQMLMISLGSNQAAECRGSNQAAECLCWQAITGLLAPAVGQIHHML